MNDFVFCTVAYGEKYRRFSKSLIEDVVIRGGCIYILTDDINYYSDYRENNSVSLVKYKNEIFSFNQKKEIVKECLKDFSTVFFLDSDVRIFDVENFDFLKDIDEGLHIFNTFGNIGDTFLNNDINKYERPNQRNTKYGDKGLSFLLENNLKYTKSYHGKDFPEAPIEHFLEGKWILKKNNGAENIFFEIWEKISSFSEGIDLELGFKSTLGAGEGANMSIAAYNSGIKLNLYSSKISKIVNNNFVSNYEQKKSGEKPWNIAG
jgi:hypothetical protein